MAAIQLRTFDCPEAILVPRMEAVLRQALEDKANVQQKRTLIPKIENSTASIRHKLTIVMYQAALICELKPDDYASFDAAMRIPHPPLLEAVAIYKGCSFKMSELSEFELFLTLFIETLAATSLSLFDVSGHLLNDLYDLDMLPTDISFFSVYKKLKGWHSTNSEEIIPLLSNYDLDDSSCVPWFSPLKKIRNQTTHRPISEICIFSHQRSIYTPINSSINEFWLSKEIFTTNIHDVKLCDFTEEIFRGLQEFTEKLYEKLSNVIRHNGSLPI